MLSNRTTAALALSGGLALGWLGGTATAVNASAAAGGVSRSTIAARVPGAMTQCEQFSERSRRARCLAWIISTGEDL